MSRPKSNLKQPYPASLETDNAGVEDHRQGPSSTLCKQAQGSSARDRQPDFSNKGATPLTTPSSRMPEPQWDSQAADHHKRYSIDVTFDANSNRPASRPSRAANASEAI